MRSFGMNGVMLVAALAMMTLAGSTLGAVDASPPRGALTMRADAGPIGKKFIVQDAGARISKAWRENTDLADKRGVIPPPTPGYRLSSRVIVQAADLTEAEDAFKGAYPGGAEALDIGDASIAVFAPVPGFFIIEMPTIAEAAVLVELLKEDPRIEDAYLDIEQPRQDRAARVPSGAGGRPSGDQPGGIDGPGEPRALPTDPGFGGQWHLMNSLNPIADANVPAAWEAGVTGAGITIGILEGGWQPNHPDLLAKLNTPASQPIVQFSSHGTSCAGVAAASANNGIGGCGAAFDARLSMQYYGDFTDNAAAFAFRNDLNAIKSNSWGPFDRGPLTYLSSLEREALRLAYTTGRNGRGTVVCFANGNGGTFDRSDIDPYAASRYTFAIAAIGDQDRRASYNELGTNILVSSHTSGNTRGIYTTDVTGEFGYSAGDYTSSFGGTSSACPLAAGIIALILEANPSLTVRDVEHILVNTARRCDPSNAEWMKNGGGRWVNMNYGFGAIDAGTAVHLARVWRNVAPEFWISTGIVPVGEIVPDGTGVPVVRTAFVTQPVRVEKVELVMNAVHTWIGDLRIVLTSPSGMQSVVSDVRFDPSDDILRYVFLTRRCWGENAQGTWKIEVSDHFGADEGLWSSYALNIYGTYEPFASEIGEPTGGTPEFDADGDGAITVDEAKEALESIGGR